MLRQTLARERRVCGHVAGKLVKVGRGQLLGAIAHRGLRIRRDLNQDPVRPTAAAARDSGPTSRRSPEAWLGSTITGRWLWSFSQGTALRSSVNRVAFSKVLIPRSHRITASFPSLST